MIFSFNNVYTRHKTLISWAVCNVYVHTEQNVNKHEIHTITKICEQEHTRTHSITAQACIFSLSSSTFGLGNALHFSLKRETVNRWKYTSLSRFFNLDEHVRIVLKLSTNDSPGIIGRLRIPLSTTTQENAITILTATSSPLLFLVTEL